MSTVTIDGKKYTMPIKAKQLSANGWTVSKAEDKKQDKSKVKAFTVSKGDRGFSAQEDKTGNISKLAENSAATDAIVLPGGIKSGIEEKELLAKLKTIPLPWKSTSDKKNAKVKKYLITVPLLSGQGYPACDYEITVEDQKVSTIGIGMVSECGSEGWAPVVLGYRAADHYNSENKEMPPFYGLEEEENKDVSVRLYEDHEDHIATLGMFRMDRSGKGYDMIGDPEAAKIIDFIKRERNDNRDTELIMKIRINVKGASRSKAAIAQMICEYPEGPMTVEEFLSETVRQNVRAYNERKDAGEILRLFSAEALENKAASGKVAYGDPMDRRKAEEGGAVRNALQCFDDGMVALFADGRRYSSREEILPLKEQSEVTFVRLTFLAGRMW